MLWRLNKPEYIFRPKQLFLRLFRAKKNKQVPQSIQVTLPFGLPLQINISETIGFAIWHLGLYDLLVSETLWRLTDPGESVADVGANIGYMTALLAARVGERGSVVAFEPHPHIFEQLFKNSTQWEKYPIGKVSLVQKAASNRRGTSTLIIPENFSLNTGTAFIEGANNYARKSGKSFEIELTTLDEEYGDGAPQVMKMDTEGSELLVLEGAKILLEQKKIRDIVFECHDACPNPLMSHLEKCGYTLFRLQKNFFGPALVPIAEIKNTHPQERIWEAASYLATVNEARAVCRFSKRGWTVLRCVR